MPFIHDVLPWLTILCPVLCPIKSEYDEENEVITLYGPKYQGKWTQVQAGQSAFAGINRDGIDKWARLRQGAKLGRSPAKLPIEEAFLKRLRANKNIVGATAKEEATRRRSRGGNRPVLVAPAMDAAAVEEEFDE